MIVLGLLFRLILSRFRIPSLGALRLGFGMCTGISVRNLGDGSTLTEQGELCATARPEKRNNRHQSDRENVERRGHINIMNP